MRAARIAAGILLALSFLRPSAPQVTHNLAFVGDSLTAGYFASDTPYGYPVLTAQASGMSYWVGAQYGVTAVYTAATMQASPKTKAVPGDALYVVVELGTNDVVASGETLTDFETAYGYILSRVHRDAPQALVVCLSTWRDPTAGAIRSGYAYNNAIASRCSDAGGTYVFIGDLFLDGALHGPAGVVTAFGVSDWFHPNNAGHAAIANRVIAVV